MMRILSLQMCKTLIFDQLKKSYGSCKNAKFPIKLNSTPVYTKNIHLRRKQFKERQ